MRPLRAAARLAAAAAATALSACAGSGTSAPEFTVLASRAPDAATALEAAELEPSRAGSARWQRTDARESFEVRTGREGNAVVRTEPRATRELAVAADGTVVLVAQRDAADGARTVFEPPMAIAPALLRAGEEPTASSAVSTERPGVKRDEAGDAHRSVRIASLDRVRTPLGEFDAVRVDAVFSMKVPFASMRRETSTWVRPGDGPVAVRSDERILVMGIVPRNTAETRVRLPGGGGAP